MSTWPKPCCNLGGAIGIAGLQTLLIRREQLHASRLGEAVTLFDPDTRARLDQLVRHFTEHGTDDPTLAWRKAVAAIGARLHEQASVMAFADTFYAMGAAMLLALATTVIYRRPAAVEAAAGAH
jgi:DHA2 family multidrug resistance protein